MSCVHVCSGVERLWLRVRVSTVIRNICSSSSSSSSSVCIIMTTDQQRCSFLFIILYICDLMICSPHNYFFGWWLGFSGVYGQIYILDQLKWPLQLLVYQIWIPSVFIHILFRPAQPPPNLLRISLTPKTNSN